ncbi:MAG: acyltransferase, partial [Anaerolineae bacterium]|nr:acyltransferase [Anaerolineae bacterium]
MRRKIALLWMRFWMRWAGLRGWGRLATRLAQIPAGVYKERRLLAYLGPCGYVSPQADIACPELAMGRNSFIDDDVTIYRHPKTQTGGAGGAVRLGERVHLYRGTIIETGDGGQVVIGDDSHIQPR